MECKGPPANHVKRNVIFIKFEFQTPKICLPPKYVLILFQILNENGTNMEKHPKIGYYSPAIKPFVTRPLCLVESHMLDAAARRKRSLSLLEVKYQVKQRSGYHYRASTRLGYQRFENGLEDEPQVGTPIPQSLNHTLLIPNHLKSELQKVRYSNSLYSDSH